MPLGKSLTLISRPIELLCNDSFAVLLMSVSVPGEDSPSLVLTGPLSSSSLTSKFSLHCEFILNGGLGAGTSCSSNLFSAVSGQLSVTSDGYNSLHF